MFRFLALSLLVAFPMAVLAGDMVVNDIKAQNGVKLSKEELDQLMPNARVVSYAGGSTRHWTNGPDGKFVAYSDARGRFKQLMAPGTGHGEWKISEKGQYCVSIEWTMKSEKWCRFMFKVGEKYYGVKSLQKGDATAYEYEIKK